MRRLLACLVAVAIGTIAIGAQQEAPATLAGVVLAADRSGQPLAHAVVSLIEPGNPVHVSVIAGEDGRFEFTDLRPGRYTVAASKPGYLKAAHGARRPGEPGTPIALTAGQRVDDVRITLARGAVIAGHLRDAAGAPAANIPVRVVPAAAALGPGEYAPAFDALTTDPSGAYRAFNLPPGEYVVVAALGNLSGRGPIYRPTAAEIDASLFALQQRVSGQPAPALPPEPGRPPLRTYGWAPIFYPGTTSAIDAVRVRVRTGEVREDVDFTIDLAPQLRVQGTVVGADGKPAPATKSISRVGPPLPVYDQSATASQSLLARWPSELGRLTASAADFSFSDLTPGLYVVAARNQEGDWAAANVRVTDSDVRDLRLVLQPRLSLSGRIVFEGSPNAPTANPAAIRVRLATLPADLASVRAADAGAGVGPIVGLPPPGPVTPAAEGTFAIADILPGCFVLDVTGAVAGTELDGWWPKSAIAGGRDLLDVPLNFGVDVHTLEDVVVTLSDRPAELTGRLQTAAGAPAPDYAVVLFSADRAHWFPGARRSRAARPATDGTFVIGELPAGEYFLAALTDAEPGVWDQPAFLEQLARAALRVTIADGASVRQDVQIAGK